MKKILVLAVSALFFVSINAQTTNPVATSKAPIKMEANTQMLLKQKKWKQQSLLM